MPYDLKSLRYTCFKSIYRIFSIENTSRKYMDVSHALTQKKIFIEDCTRNVD